jgi:MFS family permease
MIHVKMRNSQETQAEVKPLSLRTLFKLPLAGAYVLAFGDYLFIGFDISLTALWMHDHLGASVVVIGLAYVAFSIPSIITAPIGGRIADHRRRSTMILIFGLAQVPLYITYGLANSELLVIVFFAIHGVIYSFMQPAVDAHVASSTIPGARARIQGLYSAAGLLGGFAGASGCSFLYGLNFRLPLFAIAVLFGICVLIGGILVRVSESRSRNSSGLGRDLIQDEQKSMLAASE